MDVLRDFFVFSGAEIGPCFQWNLGDFLSNFEKNPNKKKFFFFVLFWKIGIFI